MEPRIDFGYKVDSSPSLHAVYLHDIVEDSTEDTDAISISRFFGWLVGFFGPESIFAEKYMTFKADQCFLSIPTFS